MHDQKLQPLRHPNPTMRSTLRFERWHRHSIYVVCAWLTLTGMMWLVAHYFMRFAGQFGETMHPFEPWSMKLHGAGAMLFLFIIGSMANSHIRGALKGQRNLVSGWTMIVVLLVLAITGYGLYYVADEASRPFWSSVHWITGAGLGALLALHVLLGRRSTK
jgi:hypothetical protein